MAVGMSAAVRGAGAGGGWWGVVGGDEVFDAAVLAQADDGAGVGAGGADFGVVADDVRVAGEVFEAGVGVVGDGVGVEAVEGFAQGGAFGQDGAPAQAGLEAFEGDAFEHGPLAGEGQAPFGVVVGEQERVVGGPGAAGEAVGAGDGADAGGGWGGHRAAPSGVSVSPVTRRVRLRRPWVSPVVGSPVPGRIFGTAW